MPPDQISSSFLSRLQDVSNSAMTFTVPEEWMTFFLMVKFIFFALSFFFILHIGYLIYNIGDIQKDATLYKELFKKKEKKEVEKDIFVMAWYGIEARMHTMQEAEYKLAIIEADKLFDSLLIRMAYKGKDMGERLKQLSTEQLSSIDAIWKCHKIRNLISHDINYHLTYAESQWVIRMYEDAFMEFGVLSRSEQGSE